MTLMIYIGIFIILSAIVFFVYSGGMEPIGRSQKEEFINFYSSVISDMNVDYRDSTISPENIHNIGISISNFSEKVKTLTPSVIQSSKETQSWFTEIIDGFYNELSLWTERHASEIDNYERSLSGSSPAISLLKTRLEIQRDNMKKIILEPEKVQ